MAFDRATTGNITGIEEVIKASDPLKKKLLMINESTIKTLKKLSYEQGVSESELVRKALKSTYG